MESGWEAAHGEVVSLLAGKDAEIAALAARVTELEGLVAALRGPTRSGFLQQWQTTVVGLAVHQEARRQALGTDAFG